MKHSIPILASLYLLIHLVCCEMYLPEKLLIMPEKQSSLQFQNKTGAGLTPQQLETFISIANYASMVYGDDLEKNMKYIKLRMDALYGKASFNFYVFIQTNKSINNWRIFVTADSVYAAVEGINKLFPKWSYFFTRNIGSNLIEEYVWFNKGFGTGITEYLYDVITILIEQFEVEDECVCSYSTLNSIGQELYYETSQAWSVVCDSQAITYSLIRSYQDQWINIKVKTCTYTIYT